MWGALLLLDFIAVLVLSAWCISAAIEGDSLGMILLLIAWIVTAVLLMVPIGNKYVQGSRRV